MPNVQVPDWDARGLLPPCNSASPTSGDRSPYRVSLTEMVLDFAVTAERVDILKGLLQYRSALHSLGITKGFQWLDGSFFEHIEMLEMRPPGDIDVVTFHEIPVGQSQASLKMADPGLFPFSPVERTALKNKFHVDAYTQSLGSRADILVSRSVYWYSMWSHRRDFTWKGFLEIDLAPDQDQLAIDELDNLPPQPSSIVANAALPNSHGTGVHP